MLFLQEVSGFFYGATSEGETITALDDPEVVPGMQLWIAAYGSASGGRIGECVIAAATEQRAREVSEESLAAQGLSSYATGQVSPYRK